jgi:oligoendopeptidase F
MEAKGLPKRSEVPIEDQWDLTSIFPNDVVWEEEFAALETLIGNAMSYQGRLGESAERLLEALRYRDELFSRLETLYVYAHLNEDTDTTNAKYQGMSSRSIALYTQGGAAWSFFRPEMIETVDETTVQSFIACNKDLAMYKHELEQLYSAKAHILSDKEESLLAQVSEVLETPSKTFSMLNNADMKFGEVTDESGNKVELSHGLYGKLLESKNRAVRKEAFETMYKPYIGLKNTFSTTITGNTKRHNFNATVRKFSSARAAALFQNHIPETVYDALIEAINERLPLLHRYVALRKKALGLSDMRMYDMYVPMVDTVDLSFTKEEAQQTVIDGLAVLGEEYQDILRKAFAERWVDWVENIGKRSGAYSSGSYTTNPYILMNWQNTLDNVYTLAHELGHSVHSYYTRKNQPFVYGDYSIFLAEIASTTNENLLTNYFLQKYDDPKIRAYIINHYLDGVKGTIFRQTQFAEFELLIHKADQEGTPLTADWLTEQYFNLNKTYYGPCMVYDDAIGFEWARIPHFYYNYYVYQYATGFSAAATLSHKILTEGQPAITAYINYLKAGSSDYPIEVLKKAGIDMTTNKPTIDALAVFEQRLCELEQLLEPNCP